MRKDHVKLKKKECAEKVYQVSCELDWAEKERKRGINVVQEDWKACQAHEADCVRAMYLVREME